VARLLVFLVNVTVRPICRVSLPVPTNGRKPSPIESFALRRSRLAARPGSAVDSGSGLRAGCRYVAGATLEARVRVVIAGAGVAGLAGALALARDGHAVTVVERDATPMPATADDAFSDWARRGAPQVRHSHAFLARLRNLLQDRAPDVLERLLAAGATEIRFAEHLPETLTDRNLRPGDDELVALACRRTTFEWVLRERALACTGVQLRDGVEITGLDATSGTRPRVVGARMRDSRPETTVPTDLFVDATGPRGGSERWLSAAGVDEPPAEVHESGIVYLSRFYRLRAGAEMPDGVAPVAGDLGHLKFAVFLGDNRTFSVTLAVASDDTELRRPLAAETGFEAAAATVVPAQAWLDGRAEPITGVHLMAGLRNRKRHFARHGRPIADGFVAIGDASVCTNPLYGRGCSLALVHAFGLADALRAHAGDLTAGLLAFDEFTSVELDPWFRAAVLQDEESKALSDEAPPASQRAQPGTDDSRELLRSVMRDGLLPALQTSPIVFRAFLRWFNLLARPDALINDGEVVSEVMAAYAARDSRPPQPSFGPSRAELLAVLERVGAAPT
jgi:2-polyprenyl-6-methoxyphenol hydroxylase-like FAD-dependent oxidoreductase